MKTGSAVINPQLLAQQHQLQVTVALQAGERVDEVQGERHDDMEQQEGHRRAPGIRPMATRGAGHGTPSGGPVQAPLCQLRRA